MKVELFLISYLDVSLIFTCLKMVTIVCTTSSSLKASWGFLLHHDIWYISFWTSKTSLYFCIEPGTEEIFREESNIVQLMQLFLLLTCCVPIKDLVNPSQLNNFLYKEYKIDCPTQLVVQNVFEIIWWKVKLKKKGLVLLEVMVQLVHYPS